jgi:hypothetical protein
MKTIFTVALFALLSVGSACSKKNDAIVAAPIDITGNWVAATVTMGSSGASSSTINADGTITTSGFLGNGTWVLKAKHFSAIFPNYQLEGDITTMQPLKIEGTLTGSKTGTFTLTPLLP